MCRDVSDVNVDPTAYGDADIAVVGALLAEPARCRVLMALNDGRGLPASMLAAEAGVAPSTASSHLSRLVDGGLLAVERYGRHRYYRLAGRPSTAGTSITASPTPAPPSSTSWVSNGTATSDTCATAWTGPSSVTICPERSAERCCAGCATSAGYGTRPRPVGPSTSPGQGVAAWRNDWGVRS